jgi:hypothetical protein
LPVLTLLTGQSAADKAYAAPFMVRYSTTYHIQFFLKGNGIKGMVAPSKNDKCWQVPRCPLITLMPVFTGNNANALIGLGYLLQRRLAVAVAV